jgi:hypothetical protein
LGLVLAIGYLSWAVRRERARAVGTAPVVEVDRSERQHWRMPPLTLLKPVSWSPGLKLGMGALRGYLVVAVLLLLVKAIRLGH